MRGPGAGADQEIFLQLPRAIQAPLQKRLTMFVLRAKAKLRDATSEPQREAVLGLVAMKDALEDPSRLLFDI